MLIWFLSLKAQRDHSFWPFPTILRIKYSYFYCCESIQSDTYKPYVFVGWDLEGQTSYDTQLKVSKTMNSSQKPTLSMILGGIWKVC